MSAFYQYIRHSTDKEDQPNSKPAQERAIGFYVQCRPQLQACSDGGIFWDNDISGGVPLWKRPAGAVLRSRIVPGDHIIAAKFDRLFRNVKDFIEVAEWCIANNVTLHVADMQLDTSTAGGKAVAQIRAVFAEMERGIGSERVKDGKAALKHTRGVSVCLTQPIGWKRVRRHDQTNKFGVPYMVLVPYGLEREEAKKLKAMRDKGWGCERIATYLNELNTPSIPVRYHDKGHTKPWSPDAVRQRIKACEKGFPAPPDCIDGRNTEQLTIEVPARG